MTRYRIALHIVPRRGILDPQGKAVSDALHSLGFPSVQDVRVGRFLTVDTTAESADAAAASAKAMCEKLLANPLRKTSKSHR